MNPFKGVTLRRIGDRREKEASCTDDDRVKSKRLSKWLVRFNEDSFEDTDQVHAIVSATVSSLGDAVKTQPWGPDYVRVAAQVLMTPSSAAVVFLDPDTMSGQTRCREMLRRILPHLPSQVFMDRSRILNSETTYGIARWIDAHGAVTGANSRRFSALMRNMSDFLAAGFAAPIGEPDNSIANKGVARA